MHLLYEGGLRAIITHSGVIAVSIVTNHQYNETNRKYYIGEREVEECGECE